EREPTALAARRRDVGDDQIVLYRSGGGDVTLPPALTGDDSVHARPSRRDEPVPGQRLEEAMKQDDLPGSGRVELLLPGGDGTIGIAIVGGVGPPCRLASPEEEVAPHHARSAGEHGPPPRLAERLGVSARVLVLVGALEQEHRPRWLEAVGAHREAVGLGVLVHPVEVHPWREPALVGGDPAEVVHVPVTGPGLAGAGRTDR